MHLESKQPVPSQNIELRIYFFKQNRYRALLCYRDKAGKNGRLARIDRVFRTPGLARAFALAFAKKHPNLKKLEAGSTRPVSSCFVARFEYRRLRAAENDLDMFDRFFFKGMRSNYWPHSSCRAIEHTSDIDDEEDEEKEFVEEISINSNANHRKRHH